MWTCEIELEDKTRMHAYKHTMTRHYLHLDAEGRAFAFQSEGSYREIAVPTAIACAFVGWECAASTDLERAALRAVVRQARWKR